MTVDFPGSYIEVTKVKSTPPGGWLIYPTNIGKDGVKHPLFVFAVSGGTTPDAYDSMAMHWDRYASYGFVVYALGRSTGNGAEVKAALDWLIAQNDASSSPLYQKLDTSKVGVAGHSQGSISVFNFMPDDRVTTTIHIAGGSLDGTGASHLRKDTLFICAPNDISTPQCETDFMNSKVPTFYTIVQGSTSLNSAKAGWPVTIAWLLWHLAGHEDPWKPAFIEAAGQFRTGLFQSKLKNWQ